MKDGIHPKYNEKVPVTCTCGFSSFVGSTINEIKVEVCHKCHPFYTGKKRLIDTIGGRIEKFNTRQSKLVATKKVKAKKQETTTKENIKKETVAKEDVKEETKTEAVTKEDVKEETKIVASEN